MFNKLPFVFVILMFSLGFASSLAPFEFFPVQAYSILQQNIMSEKFFNNFPPSFFVNPYSRLFSPQEIFAIVSANSTNSSYPPNSVYSTMDTCDSNGNLQEVISLSDIEWIFGLDPDPTGPWVGKVEVSPGDLGPLGTWTCHDTQTDGPNSVVSTGAFFLRTDFLSNILLSNLTKPGPIINFTTYDAITPFSLDFTFSAAAQPGYTLIGQYILGPMDNVNMPFLIYSQGVPTPSPNFVATPPIALSRVPGGSAVYHVCALQDNGIEQVAECKVIII